MDFVIKGIIEAFPKVLAYADRNRICKRKSVGCCIAEVVDEQMLFIPTFSANGPSGQGHECTNVVGNCGCSHAEPRAIMKYLKARRGIESPRVLICTYSPCTNCANIIIDSGIIGAVVYDILTEHDKRGDEFLRMEMPVFTARELQSGAAHDSLREWYIRSRECF